MQVGWLGAAITEHCLPQAESGDRSGLGAQIVIYDGGGSQIAIEEPGGFSDPSLTYTFATAGVYYVAVESDSILWNTDGPFMLNVSL